MPISVVIADDHSLVRQGLRRYLEMAGDIEVLGEASNDDRQFVVEAVRAGARGYVLKARDAEHLIQTVRLVASGNMVIDPQLVVALAEELSAAADRDKKAETLTAREIEVLQLLAFGHTNKDIAEQLFISPDTVKTHLEHIFDKLGTSDRTAAVAEALRRRLIE
jgi:NarL family two-component system response regulator LiaR